ncbi:hypothetical protein [Alkalimonas amylolytica]|uniref:Uncharacterized protein n=1 Tax=Alkalimonas amylolytica TaxID=152573 RepID=A0A1H4DD78_ALKAM|nr:hypothetical protein [Alkalimonas amylolytica]SEA70349.1 hypothetical protein SAMN04488051_105177 [Alkalimonas amylolytica]
MMQAEGIKVCAELCEDPAFIRALDQLASSIAMKIGMANDDLTKDVRRQNQELGAVIYHRSANPVGSRPVRYEVSRVGTDVPLMGRVGEQNGFATSYPEISKDENVVAVVIGLRPNTRLHILTMPNRKNFWLNYANRVNRPVFLVGTGQLAGVRFIVHNEQFERLR